jgi:hypothetical protein
MLNLYSGADQFGNALGMVHLTRLHLVNLDVTGIATRNLGVGGGVNPVISGEQDTVQSAGELLKTSPNPGFQVAHGSADTLQIVSSQSGITIPFALLLLGRSA